MQNDEMGNSATIMWRPNYYKLQSSIDRNNNKNCRVTYCGSQQGSDKTQFRKENTCILENTYSTAVIPSFCNTAWATYDVKIVNIIISFWNVQIDDRACTALMSEIQCKLHCLSSTFLIYLKLMCSLPLIPGMSIKWFGIVSVFQNWKKKTLSA